MNKLVQPKSDSVIYFAYLWTNGSQNGYSGRASSPDGGDAAGALAWRFEFGTPARHCCCRAGQPSAAVAAAGCVLAPSSQLSHVGRRHLQRSRAGTVQRFIYHRTILVTSGLGDV